MKKKSIIILASVVVVCALGLLLSQVFNWPVDTRNASGNISKSSHFSRKTADAGISNMQELLQTDENYRNNIVAAYYIMQMRAQEFDVLVDLSNKAAGGIKEFEGVLKEMNEAKPMIDNVCASMATAGQNLNTALGGEPCEELAESVTNSALAYTTLQKQNKLADKFINVADKYLAKNEGSDDLKFVRDQWLDYQQMTAALNGDEKAAANLASKGHQLNADQTLAVLSAYEDGVKNIIVQNGVVFHSLEIDSPVADVIDIDVASMVNTGDANRMVNTDDMASMVNTGDANRMVNTDDMARMVNTDDMASMVNTGDANRMVNTDDMASMINTGDMTGNVLVIVRNGVLFNQDVDVDVVKNLVNNTIVQLATGDGENLVGHSIDDLNR